MIFKTDVWFYVMWNLVALSLVVTRTFQLELERFCTLAWLFWGYCICSSQLLHHSACLQFSSLVLVLSYDITGALKVFFSSHEQITPILMLWYEHLGFLSFYISHSLPQKRRSFSKHGEGCRPASLLGMSSEKDSWDFQSLSFLLLVVDCEEITLASSHSVCCWTVFPVLQMISASAFQMDGF